MGAAYKLAAIDIFCGVGGMTHGLIKEGIRVKAGFDIDEKCRYAYEENNRCKFVRKDVRELLAEDVKSIFDNEEIRVIVGCAPCQPFSRHTQKNRNRITDENRGLQNAFAKVIETVKPEIVSVENVADIVKQDVFEEFVNKLKSLEYIVNWEIVYCPDYGIPQTRKRLILLASKLGEIRLIKKTYKPDNYVTVRDKIGKLEAIGDGEISSKDPLHRAMKLSDKNKRRIEQSKQGGTWRDWDEKLRTECHKKASGKSYSGVYGRMSWDEPGPTLTTEFYLYGTGRFGHPEQDRAISLREGAMLQTFPRYYKFVRKKEEIYFTTVGRHIGNAVPVKLGRVISRSIKKHLEGVGYGRA